MMDPREIIARDLAIDPRVNIGTHADYLEQADEIIADLREKGYAIVPREPTPKMEAAARAVQVFVSERDGYRPMDRSEGERAYRAMLSAAEEPTPQGERG